MSDPVTLRRRSEIHSNAAGQMAPDRIQPSTPFIRQKVNTLQRQFGIHQSNMPCTARPRGTVHGFIYSLFRSQTSSSSHAASSLWSGWCGLEQWPPQGTPSTAEVTVHALSIVCLPAYSSANASGSWQKADPGRTRLWTVDMSWVRSLSRQIRCGTCTSFTASRALPLLVHDTS